ncbi:DUF3110 domain-containing protein [Anabaena catenula FACHB-362]|uniref:DUF3110 domain-containing protein n=2 Tax=Anabaena TaxID=1163 RepID=A0ABR8J4M6_9NOST|nr:DUF3110 domain-containing protein [Anabaena catenula]MBD2691976.1 DUF3110 domain-containing protein [Anabaena catenula FACHB-362]
MMRVFVLIFNAGTDNEGIHTVLTGDPEAGLSGARRNKILMFESEDDATRYALMLEAQDFASPTVEVMNAQEIKEFCESAGYDWELIPENSNLVVTPPEVNVEQTDWQPEAETIDTDEDSLYFNPSTTPVQEPDSDLDSIRRRLEGLL